jgi:hypothetical protein
MIYVACTPSSLASSIVESCTIEDLCYNHLKTSSESTSFSLLLWRTISLYIMGYLVLHCTGESMVRQSLALVRVKDPFFKRSGASRLSQIATDGVLCFLPIDYYHFFPYCSVLQLPHVKLTTVETWAATKYISFGVYCIIIYSSTPTVRSWWLQLVAACHCYLWSMWWSDTLWATLIRLRLHSLLSYLQIGRSWDFSSFW